VYYEVHGRRGDHLGLKKIRKQLPGAVPPPRRLRVFVRFSVVVRTTRPLGRRLVLLVGKFHRPLYPQPARLFSRLVLLPHRKPRLAYLRAANHTPALVRCAARRVYADTIKAESVSPVWAIAEAERVGWEKALTRKRSRCRSPRRCREFAGRTWLTTRVQNPRLTYRQLFVSKRARV
jgi:hypothetical protein